MANGKHIYGSDGGGTVSITVPSGVITNTTVTLQDKNGTVSRLEDNGGRRNYLINGNFDKWDYASSQTTSSGYGSDNRWLNGNNGSNKTHSQVACTDVERALFNSTYFSRTVVSSVAGTTNGIYKQHKIENINNLAGKTVTLSFWAKADSNKNLGLSLEQFFGTGGSPSAQIHKIVDQIFVLTSTWQKFTKTFTIPNIVGKTIGSDGGHTTFHQLTFWFDAGSTLSSSFCTGMIQQSGTFDIAQVKIEDGTVATDGWHPYDGEFGSEVQACQRYYATNQVNAQFYSPIANSVWAISVPHPVPMRVAPTCTIDNPNGQGNIGTLSASGTNTLYNVISGLVTNIGAVSISTAIKLSAEL